MKKALIFLAIISADVSAAQEQYPELPNLYTVLLKNKALMNKLGYAYVDSVEWPFTNDWSSSQYLLDDANNMMYGYVSLGGSKCTSDPYLVSANLFRTGKRIDSMKGCRDNMPFSCKYIAQPENYSGVLEGQDKFLYAKFTYDLNGRVIEAASPLSMGRYSFFYDDQGRLSKYVYSIPNIQSTTFLIEYDGQGRFSSVPGIWEYEYNKEGLLKSAVTYPNGPSRKGYKRKLSYRKL